MSMNGKREPMREKENVMKYTAFEYTKLRHAYKQHCIYGMHHFCDGSSADRKYAAKKPCPYFKSGCCTKSEIAATKANFKKVREYKEYV